MSKRLFKSTTQLQSCIDAYFLYIEGGYNTENEIIRQPEPATISGLALFLNFSSREDFERYEQSGKFASVLKRGRLRIEAAYEKKLHQQSPSAAIFALKSMGWAEKADAKPVAANTFQTLKIEIKETGPKPASTEKEVIL